MIPLVVRIGPWCIVGALAACAGAGSTDPGVSSASQWSSNTYLSVSYTVDYGNGHLLAYPVITNIGTDTLRGGVTRNCALLLRAYTTPARSGDPVWPREGTIEACPAMAEGILLAPGDSVALSMQVVRTFVNDVRARHGLGTYYFTASVHLSEPDAWLPVVAAGEVQLQQ